MSFETYQQYPPVDVELVDRIVCKLKSQGIFDQFRKDCMADVDTKPAYQNLQQRVNGTVATFLADQTWQQDLNKTQLRESLRRHVQQGFLEVGVDRIVDQVVNPKVFTIFMPKVEDVVYDCLGLEKPKHPPPSSNLLTRRKLTLLDLLPKDLDPVSPDSDNLSFDDDETKDETNNNESLSKLDMSNDSQVSGISDLSSHMGDSFKEIQENHVNSNSAKSSASDKENSNELHFENFENLSEKIKQAEIGHNPVVSSQSEIPDCVESRTVISVEQNDLIKDNKEDTSMEIDSISNSTFEDTKLFPNKILKEDTCCRSMSEDSTSCSSMNAKLKKEKSLLPLADNCTNSVDKSEVVTPYKESSRDKDIKAPIISEDIEMKTEEKVGENKEPKKIEESKDKKHRDSSSSSSKASKSSSDRNRPSESKHRSSNDKKDDVKQTKEKNVKDDKDKEKVNRDEKEKNNKHKEDRHYSSKDKHRDKEKYLDKNKEKDCEKKKDKTDSKDTPEKDRKNEKELEKDKYKDKDKNDKDRSRHDKENHRHDKEKYRQEKDKERHEKEKDRHDREKEKRDKDKHEKNKRDKEKLEKSNKYDGKEKDRDRNDREKDKSEKDRSRDKEKGKSEKENKSEKDKENARFVEDKYRDEKKKESKKYEKQASSSSLKKDDYYKNDSKEKNKRSDENSKEKSLNNKVGKSEEERRERKRKAERCNDDIKLKEARRSWDRDSSGGNGRGHVSQKPSTSEYRVSVSSGSTKEKQSGECSNQQKTSERNLEPVSATEEPSDVDKILMKINSSIEESQSVSVNDEHSVKKPKIARNIYEIKKIMLARKNLARQMRIEKKKKETSEVVNKVDVTDSPSTAQQPPNNPVTREENKENIKTDQLDKLKSSKVCQIKGKFNGFLESDIEKSRNHLQNFRTTFFNYCTSMGINITPTDDIENVDFTKVCDFNEDLLDDNLNKLKPKSVSLERRSTYPEDKKVNKAVESLISGMNGCYVLLQDCTEVVEAMRNAAQQHPETPMRKTVSSPIIKRNPYGHSSQENSKAIGSLRIPKKTVNNPFPNRANPILPRCVVDMRPEVIRRGLQNHLPPVKKGTSDVTSLPAPVKQQLKQDQQDSEPSSPGVTVSVALNSFLNDSVLNNVHEPPSATLTEAMLDNLMRESSMIVDDEGFEDSDSSDHEYLSQFRDTVKKLEENHELYNEKELIRHVTSKANSTFGSLSDETSIVLSDGELAVPVKKKAVADVDASSCDMITPEEGSPQDRCEDKSMKRRNQRLCRSASQRYDSTDLYKPRPVLPQNAKRVRAPRSVSSEELSLKEQFEVSPPKKRAR